MIGRRVGPRLLIVTLVILLVILQYKLWFATGGVGSMVSLHHSLEAQYAQNTQLQERNHVLDAEVTDLKNGGQAIEERARNNMGMIKKGETFYQIVPDPSVNHANNTHTGNHG